MKKSTSPLRKSRDDESSDEDLTTEAKGLIFYCSLKHKNIFVHRDIKDCENVIFCGPIL